MSGHHGHGSGGGDQRHPDRRGRDDQRERSPRVPQEGFGPPARDTNPYARGHGGGRGDYRGGNSHHHGRGQDSGRGDFRGGSRGRGDGSRGGFGRGGRGGGMFGASQRDDYVKAENTSELVELPLLKDVPQPPSSRALPIREPKLRGKAGKFITVAVNHFPILTLPTIKVHCFEILMKIPSGSQRRGNEKVSARQQTAAMIAGEHLWGNHFVFDGVSRGWSTDELIPEGKERVALLPLPGHTEDRPNQVQATVRCTGSLDLKKFVLEYLAHPTPLGQRQSSRVQTVMDWLNATYRADPATRFIQGKPNSSAYFIRRAKLCVPLMSTNGVLEAMRGIFQSATVAFGRLSLNLDTTTTVFYTPDKDLLDISRAFSGCTVQELSTVGTNGEFLRACERMVGMYFSVGHLGQIGNSKKMRIKGILTTSARTTIFDYMQSDGSSVKTSVLDYFKSKYGRSLDYPDLPLVHCRDGSFPMELCHTSPGERYMEPLQGPETADFINFATSPPSIREQHIYENAKRLHWHQLAVPASHGLSVSTEMLKVRARILPAPALIYGAGGPRESELITGSWNLRGARLKQPASYKYAGIAYLGRRHRKDEILQFYTKFTYGLKALGINIPRDGPCYVDNLTGRRAAKDLYEQTGNMFRVKPDVLFFILDDSQKAAYKELKAACEVELGVPSQVMSSSKCMRGQDQYIANVGLKLNAKLGGINWVVPEPLFDQTPWMIIGADCSHPSPGQLRQIPPPPSYAVLTGSVDKSCVKYTAVAVAQSATVELISRTRDMTAELLKRFHEKHNRFPRNILYLRDGISSSQITALLATEVGGIKEAIKGTRAEIRVGVLNCLKRHHTRFFPNPRNPQDGDRNGNVLPGTVVESRDKEDHFFLVAQMGLKGTCRPTHYQVILDEIGLTADDIQRLIYNGSFTFARATKSVSLHPAVRYAHIACERARMHLFTNSEGIVELKDCHSNLRDTMYFQ